MRVTGVACQRATKGQFSHLWRNNLAITISVRYHIGLLSIFPTEIRFDDDTQIIVVGKRQISVGFTTLGVLDELGFRQDGLSHHFETGIVTVVARKRKKERISVYSRI